MRRKVLSGLAVASAAVATGGTLVALQSPVVAATPVPITQSCLVDPPLTGDPFEISTAFVGVAPASASKNTVISGSGTAQPWTVPSDVNSMAVDSVTDFSVSFALSSNATVVGASLSGGDNLGTGTPTVSQSGNVVTLVVPGPLTPGSIVQLPTVNLAIQTGAAGTVSLGLAGTSYDDPGAAVTGTVENGEDAVTQPASCYPTTTPVLTRTVVH